MPATKSNSTATSSQRSGGVAAIPHWASLTPRPVPRRGCWRHRGRAGWGCRAWLRAGWCGGEGVDGGAETRAALFEIAELIVARADGESRTTSPGCSQGRASGIASSNVAAWCTARLPRRGPAPPRRSSLGLAEHDQVACPPGRRPRPSGPRVGACRARRPAARSVRRSYPTQRCCARARWRWSRSRSARRPRRPLSPGGGGRPGTRPARANGLGADASGRGERADGQGVGQIVTAAQA